MTLDLYEDFDPFEDEDGWVTCPDCGGTGLTIESFDCSFCDGDGLIEV
jgi:DnaJ-class molecular chaperone